jgi:hypothetical protein
MSEKAIVKAIKEVYGNAKQVGPPQGNRVLLRGTASGLTKLMTVEMWYNRLTNRIETAYPKI